MVVKYRALLAECRLVVRAFFSQILDDAQCAPRQHETHAQKQQKSDRKIHHRHRVLEPSGESKFGALFCAVGTRLIILSEAQIHLRGLFQCRQHASPQLAKSDRDGAGPLAPASENHGVAIFQKGALLMTDLQRLAAALAEFDQ